MYLEHFGLRAMPFEATSNATVYVDLPTHREALNTVLFGLRSGEGFVKVVGEVGTGKTALCRNLLASLEPGYRPVYLPNPSIRSHDLLLTIADELGVPTKSWTSAHELQKIIRQRLLEIARSGGRSVVFVDEAQTMPAATLEELRLLSNLETNRGKLVQVVLFGQPELDEKLAHYSLRQLQQRIAFSARLERLDREACRLYIRLRLVQSGARTKTIFEPAAIARIHRSSGGIPRLINVLCHKSLMAAFADGEFQVGKRHVTRARNDTEGIQRWRRRPLFQSKVDPRGGSEAPRSDWRNLPD